MFVQYKREIESHNCQTEALSTSNISFFSLSWAFFQISPLFLVILFQIQKKKNFSFLLDSSFA